MWSAIKALLPGSDVEPDRQPIVLPVGSSVEDLALSAFTSLHRGQSLNDTVYELSAKFQLNKEDAVSALHRILVGIAAARPTRPEKPPDQESDPIGWASYQVALQEPEAVRRIMG